MDKKTFFQILHWIEYIYVEKKNEFNEMLREKIEKEGYDRHHRKHKKQ